MVAGTYVVSLHSELTATIGTLSNPYRFGGSYGAYTDVSTGLLKLGQRFYDPALGRWTQPDPLLNLQDPLQWNRYGYVAGNPANLIDPSGLRHCTPLQAGATIGAFGVALLTAAGTVLLAPETLGGSLLVAGAVGGVFVTEAFALDCIYV